MRYLLEDAIDHVPPATLLTIVRQYIDVRRLRPGGRQTRKASATLLGTVKAFEQASLAGDYFESFDVNSKNFAELARRLHWQLPQVDRLFDVRHRSRLDQLEAAAAVLGKRFTVAVSELTTRASGTTAVGQRQRRRATRRRPSSQKGG